MLIPEKDINTNSILIAAQETVDQVLARLPADRAARAFLYIVLPVADGRYVVARWLEIEQIAVRMSQDRRELPLSSLQDLLKPVAAVERDNVGTARLVNNVTRSLASGW